MTDQTFPKQQYTSIETAELDRLRARIAELEQTAENKLFEHGQKLGEQVLDNRRLLNELDKLRPLEFLLKREGSVTEQMHEKLIELTRKLRNMERGRGPTPDYTGEGSAWVPPVEAQAVVVPELTESKITSVVGGPQTATGGYGYLRLGFKHGWGACAKEIRAISPDRVLGGGMVAVDRGEIELLRKIAGMWCPPFGVPHNPESVALFDHLRANQGGAAT